MIHLCKTDRFKGKLLKTHITLLLNSRQARPVARQAGAACPASPAA